MSGNLCTLLRFRNIDPGGLATSAIARGVPILATAIDVVEVEGGARLVPPADPTALVRLVSDWTTRPFSFKPSLNRWVRGELHKILNAIPLFIRRHTLVGWLTASTRAAHRSP